MSGKAKQVVVKPAMIRVGDMANKHKPALCNGKAPSSLKKK